MSDNPGFCQAASQPDGGGSVGVFASSLDALWVVFLSLYLSSVVVIGARHLWWRRTTTPFSVWAEDSRGSQARLIIRNDGKDADVNAEIAIRPTDESGFTDRGRFKASWEQSDSEYVHIPHGDFATIVVGEITHATKDGTMLEVKLFKSTASGRKVATGKAWSRVRHPAPGYTVFLQVRSPTRLTKPCSIDFTLQATDLASFDLIDWRPRD